jgi:hypothetical protein
VSIILDAMSTISNAHVCNSPHKNPTTDRTLDPDKIYDVIVNGVRGKIHLEIKECSACGGYYLYCPVRKQALS